MKKYEMPKFEKVAISDIDIITTSPGTESPILGESDGIWDFEEFTNP